MKTYATHSINKPDSFYKEGLTWQYVRNHALNYYGVQHLFYKEVMADDFFIDCMIGLVGSIKLSLYPNAEPVLTIKLKEVDTMKIGYQLDMNFQSRNHQHSRV